MKRNRSPTRMAVLEAPRGPTDNPIGSFTADLSSLAQAGSAELPERVPLHPFGAFRGNGKDFVFDEQSLAIVRAQVEQIGNLFVVDWHHQTRDVEKGKRDTAPAALWLKDVVVEDGYVYGVVESWTPKGAEAVRSKEYRYLSAVFPYDSEGRVLGYHSFGLVNRAGTYHQRVIGLGARRLVDHRLAALELSYDDIRRLLFAAVQERFGDNSYPTEVFDDHVIVETDGGKFLKIGYRIENETVRFDSEPVEVRKTYTEARDRELVMLERLRKLLGLSDSATEDEVMAKLQALTGTNQQLAALAAIAGTEPDATAILGAVQGLKQAAGQVAALTARTQELEAQLAKRELDELLEQGQAEGKITPAMATAILGADDAWAWARNPKSLRAYLGATPQVAAVGGERHQPADKGKPNVAVLSAEDKAVARQLGLSDEAFAAGKLKGAN
jgi:phage I-like protein